MMRSRDTISKIQRPSPDTASRGTHYRFDRNERTTLFTDEEFREMLSVLNPYDFVAYGELEPLYIKAAKWLDVDRENILFTSGSDMGIKAIFETFIEKDDKVLVSLPNYAMFSVYTQMFGGIELKHWYRKDLTLDVDHFIEDMSKDLKIIIISNPGHTGKSVSEKDLLRIIQKASRQETLVLVDEAYFHFYDKTMISYVDHYKNLIISRTFSKAFGLASLRIGILIACNSLIAEIYRVKLIHEITGVAAKIGAFMLDHPEIMGNYVENVNQGKAVLYRRLPTFGIEVFQSDSNFVFFRPPGNIRTENLVRFLEEISIYIKGPFRDQTLDGLFRVTAGDVSQMNLFCDELINYYRTT